jgi:hypothetical protein
MGAGVTEPIEPSAPIFVSRPQKPQFSTRKGLESLSASDVLPTPGCRPVTRLTMNNIRSPITIVMSLRCNPEGHIPGVMTSFTQPSFSDSVRFDIQIYTNRRAASVPKHTAINSKPTATILRKNQVVKA